MGGHQTHARLRRVKTPPQAGSFGLVRQSGQDPLDALIDGVGPDHIVL